MRSGPENTYELYSRRFVFYNLFGDEITMVFSGIHHQQFDYGWYNELARPIHEAMNRRWSPIANNPDQNAELSRNFELSYPVRPRMSAVLIHAGNDNAMWSMTKIYGIEDAEDYTSSGGSGGRNWYIEYNPDDGTYYVKSVNCAAANVVLADQYPTKVEISAYTTWSGINPYFRMVILGGDISWSSVQESPYPGDDGNPEPMKCVIQPGVNVIDGE